MVYLARRCPRVTVEGKNMKVRSKTFERGDCLSTTVHVHDSSRPPTPPPRQAHCADVEANSCTLEQTMEPESFKRFTTQLCQALKAPKQKQ
eukprot:5256771-Amphidinium_carterae.1